MAIRTFQLKWTLVPHGVGYTSLDADARHAAVQEASEVLIGRLNDAAQAMVQDLAVDVNGEVALDLNPVKAVLEQRSAVLAADGGQDWAGFSLIFGSLQDGWEIDPGPPVEIRCDHGLPSALTFSLPSNEAVQFRICIRGKCQDCEFTIPNQAGN